MTLIPINGMSGAFSVAAGSVIGREHARLRRNNQDGVAFRAAGGLVAAVVTDGCSSSRASEVGAKLAAEWIAARAPAFARCADHEADARAIVDQLVAFLEGVGRELSPDERLSSELVGDLFLFTVLAAVVGPEHAFVFGVGDGVFAINGAVKRLESGSENAPRYPAYRLVGSSMLEVDPGSLDPVVHAVVRTEEVESIIIATDGALELEDRSAELLRDGRSQGGLEALSRLYGSGDNPTLWHKRLNAIGAVHGRLRDDTTVVSIRRRSGTS